ncbi:MAG: carbohydrate binding family 9 domain-containing protein [Candidatus Latescibacterota bacterium]|nr:MAG: carbohydrate binding family 9 domain-containing protein [Candidatus Latescibacterota bacterium]
MRDTLRPNGGKTVLRILFLILAAWVLHPGLAAGADGDYTPVYHPKLKISRAAGPIKIDGELQDPGWSGAAKADNFAEHNPGDQTKPEVKTEVLITYDDDNLYVAWLCYDDPDEVRASFCERDQIFSDDYVILCLDTFGEATLAYEISSNPYGVPGDLLFSSANGEDISYDMIYESAGRITDFGWVVEMQIPFTGMRFPDREEQVWRVDFWRNRPRESRYQYSWAAYDRDENCWPCQWGTVSGITGIKPSAGLELLPAVIGHQSGSLNDDNRFDNNNIEGDLALGIAYDISSELTAEGTVNPDFSQVESDVAQIDVNTTFALFYPERRPFFQEGSDLFDTYFNALYTRSINDPILAGKTTWRKGSNSVAFLTARDDHSVIILPFEESSSFVENGKSVSNIVRARHDLGEQSHLGLIATDRRFNGGGSGSLFGVDGRIRLSASDAFRFQVLASHTEEVDNLALTDSSFNVTRFDDDKHTAGLDGEKFWGHGVYAGLSRDARSYWFGGEYWERSPTFRADNGFEPSNSWRLGSMWVGGIKRFDNSKILENVNGSVDFAGKWNLDGVKKDEWINLSAQVRFRAAQTQIHSNLLWSGELFGGIQFDDIWQAHTCFSTQPGQAINGGGHFNYGHRIARWDLVMGKEINYGLWADIRPIDRILVSTSFNSAFSDNLETDERLFSQSIWRTRLSLQVTRELSARVVLQYNDRYDGWDFDPLITYRLNPFSIFYIGSTHDFRDLNPIDHGREGWTLTNRQYFLKIQYLFQL